MKWFNLETPSIPPTPFETLELALGVSLSTQIPEIWVTHDGVTALYIFEPGPPPRYELLYSSPRSTFLFDMDVHVITHPKGAPQ